MKNHVCSREEVLASNPTVLYIWAKRFPSIFETFDEYPLIETLYTVLYTFFQGTSRVKYVCQLMRVSFAGLNYCLREFHQSLSLCHWSY